MYSEVKYGIQFIIRKQGDILELYINTGRYQMFQSTQANMTLRIFGYKLI